MKIIETFIEGVVCIEPEVHEDNRGSFMEILNIDKLPTGMFKNGIRQVSQSRSRRGVIRGLHLQYAPLMGKALRVIKGEALIVNVDMRRDSPTYTEAVYVTLSEYSNRLVYAPGWCARGFFAVEPVVIEYYHDAVRNDASAVTIAWNDPLLNVAWGTLSPVISSNDSRGISLKEWEANYLL